MASDTKTVIAEAIARVLAEVPALINLKLIFALELRSKGDVQHYRVELPGPKIEKLVPDDARIRVEVQRPVFNEMAEKGTLKAWHAAYDRGDLKASGNEQILKLIAQVVGRQEERARTRKARQPSAGN
ncbi:MAG: hypothetical protein NTV40_01845 [Solirubrobacterales bacterium]|nr:hypothetical protein [Solirubrobacterales bacterium]